MTCSSAVALSDQAFALEIRDPQAPMDFELLDVNAINHDRWNFGEKRIGRRAPILIVQSSERPARRTYLGASEATIFSKRGSPRNGSQYGCKRSSP